jgi:hypothetical protein
MDAHCPRCQSTLPHVTNVVLQTGVCPKCGGQICFGDVSADLRIDGAIAMTFAVGSKVAVALDASFESSKLGLAEAPTSGWADDEDTHPGRRRALPPPLPASIDTEDTIRTPPQFGGIMTRRSVGVAPVEMRPMAELPSSPKADLPETLDTQAPQVEMPKAPTAEVAEPSGSGSGSGLGAHLQLPSIDFSFPDFAKPGTAPAVDASALPTPSAHLPAHMQLPSFPDFQLPPIPGVEQERSSSEFEIKGVDGGASSFAAMTAGASPAVTSPSASPAGATAGGDQWAVAAPGTTPVVAPPPLRPPPPLRSKTKPPVPAAPVGGLSNMPALGLPFLQSAAKPKEATLLGSDAAAQIVADMHKKKSSPAVYVAGVLVVVVLAIGGVLLYYGPGTVLGWFHTPDTRHASKSEREQADEVFVEGVKAYQAEKYPEAIKLFEKALALDPNHVDVQRSLGIAYAKTNNPKKAVDHYETYLKLAPTAPDAATVRKFVDDYKQAQEKSKGGKKK